jgi:hypothetical protein
VLMLKNHNGMVFDAEAELAEWNYSAAMKWSDREKQIFLLKMQVYGKSFQKIALHLPGIYS